MSASSRRHATLGLTLAAVGACTGPRAAAPSQPTSPTRLAADLVPQPAARAASDVWYTLTLHGEKIGYAHETTHPTTDGITLRREEVVVMTRHGAPAHFDAVYDAAVAMGTWSGTVRTSINGVAQSQSLVPEGPAASNCMPAVFAASWVALGQPVPRCGYDPTYDGLLLPASTTATPMGDGSTRWAITWQHPWGPLSTTVSGRQGHPPDVVASSDGSRAQRTTAPLAQATWTPPDLLVLTAVAAQQYGDTLRIPVTSWPRLAQPAPVPFPGQSEVTTDDGAWSTFRLAHAPLPLAALPPRPGEQASTTRELDELMRELHDTISPSLALGVVNVGDCRIMSAQLGDALRRRHIAFRYATGWRYDTAGQRLIRHRWLVVLIAGGWISIDPAFAEVPARGALIGLVLEDPQLGPPQGDLVFDLGQAPSTTPSRDE